MGNRRLERTQDFENQKYSPELIRKYENPHYAKEAERYEREARKHAAKHSKKRKKGNTQKAKNSNYRPPSGTSSDMGNERKRKYKVNKKKVFRNIVILLLLLCGIGLALFYHLTGTFDTIDTSKNNFAVDDKVADELSGYRNIAILGVDARADEGYKGARTDAIIVLSINKSNGDIKLISVMRDSYLRMQYFDGKMILDKITHAHHYLGGYNTCAALNRSLDLNIEEYVTFNWKSVSDAVDCLGGVEINVKSNEIADLNKYGNETAKNVGGTYTQITKPGVQTLSGTQATTYCRIRKSSGGDSSRSNRYKTVLSAMIKKTLTHPTKLGELSKKVFPNIQTNMSQTEMLTLGIKAPFYDIGGGISWPKTYYAGLLNDGLSYVVPTTLESNVKWLHAKAFGQKDYALSNTCSQVNQDIINDTGIQ